jgi:hypothetical protein
MKAQWKAWRLWVKKASQGKFKFPVRKMPDGNAADELQNWITGFSALLDTNEIKKAREFRTKSLAMEQDMGTALLDPCNAPDAVEGFDFDEEELRKKCEEIIAKAKHQEKGGRSTKHKKEEKAAAQARAAQNIVEHPLVINDPALDGAPANLPAPAAPEGGAGQEEAGENSDGEDEALAEIAGQFVMDDNVNADFDEETEIRSWLEAEGLVEEEEESEAETEDDE